MYLEAQQIQFPVGQGGLHLAQLRLLTKTSHASPSPISIMFDCGGMGSSAALSGCLSAARLALAVQSGRRRLHLLMLSHLHADHINGFKQLIGSGPIAIDRLIIPHYDDDDRLVLLAQLADQTADIDLVMQVDEITADPGQWFGDRGVGQVIQIASGGDDGTGGAAPEPPTPDPKVRLDEDEGREATLSVGLTDHDGQAVPADGKPQVLKNGVMARMVINAAQSTGVPTDWVALPFCLQAAPGHGGHRDKARFVRAVKAILTNHRNVAGLLDVKPANATAVLAALINEFRQYVGIQHQTWNALSLSLFNGLERKRKFERYVSPDRSVFAFFELASPLFPIRLALSHPMIYLGRTHASAWMHTGDSELINGAKEWSTFYRTRQGGCSIFQLPHHGSANNFDGTVSILPNSVAFATCRSGSRHHPAASVKSLVQARNAEFHSVNELPASAVQSFTIAQV
jgi:hypothetical protein